ncbi:MAG: peptidoglycan DD-metalloendopeptidase family protein [Lachnospiraceae bacterium]
MKKQYYVSLLVGLLVIVAAGALYMTSASRKKTQLEQYMNENRMAEADETADVAQFDKEKVNAQNSDMPDVPDNMETEEDGESEEEGGAGDVPSGYDGTTKLQWPVVGNVILPYSMDATVYYKTLEQYKCNPAMLIEAKKGASVCNVYQGTVTEIDDKGQTGTTVCVDCGNQYRMTYGQLEDIMVKVGDKVDTGAILGTVAKPSRFYTKEGSHLYFAVTKDEKPVDPLTILTQ